MRKDPSTLETEFIQGGSLGDNTTQHTDINSVENLTTLVGDCDSSTANNNTISCLARNNIDYTKEQRDEASLKMDCYADDKSASTCSISPCSSFDVEAIATTSTRVSKTGIAKSVRFSTCSIRSYNQVLGDHPLCAVGCPIALGWRVMKEESFSVEDHEVLRESLRKKKGAKSPTNFRRKRLSQGDEPLAPTLRYINSQLRLSAHERRDRLQDYSDAQIRKEWSRMQKQSKRGLIKEGLRQFRAVGMHYAGF